MTGTVTISINDFDNMRKAYDNRGKDIEDARRMYHSQIQWVYRNKNEHAILLEYSEVDKIIRESRL